jgi:hypothetical protein
MIETAGYEARSTVMEAALSAQRLLTGLKIAYSDVLDKTVDELLGVERKTFEDARAIVDALAEAVGEGIVGEQLSPLVAKTTAALGNLPFSANDPVVTGYSPTFFVAESQRGEVRLTVEGIKLAGGEPVLVIGGEAFQPAAKTDQQLLFLIPRHALASPTEIEPVTGDLLVYKETRSWLVFKNLEPRTYRLTTFAVPPVIGSYEVSSKLKEVRTERKPWHSVDFRCESPHKGRDQQRHHVSAPEGWKIDTSTIKAALSYQNHGKYEIHSPTESGFDFVIKCWAWNYSALWNGSKGVISGKFNFDLSKMRSVNLLQRVHWDGGKSSSSMFPMMQSV